ncbi:tannase/feruloyl esterase family alpha/beta hydrolase [Altericroceibacterium endophyticum]|uniref:Tannase/feruloyl esterase family alpha/beta hydrolase n=1 Tax=Altericroceibacterium endophyticum TaxID=1808508 RepID=A0A6I4T8Y5_9SPHN|nr:tannase/feruloyl esterase family alpha/beta hydrolase [Altericroceibacterium endophyticum]MXO66591.1 tannase/feruloyl esterase family alpha/beta hydrolase [Altericroceibacterium endophyticum]
MRKQLTQLSILCVSLIAGLVTAAAPEPARAAPISASSAPLIALPERAEIAPVMDCDALVVPVSQNSGDIVYRIRSATREQADQEHPASCLVKGYTAPQTEFELRLPLSGYNGRFLQGGCGGMCGVIGTQITPRCSNAHTVSGGFAVAFNNGGHHSAGIGDATWAVGDPELREQFAHKAAHAVAVASKSIIQQFYGAPPEWSYFAGCSGGGREALVEVQRYPEDFDGVVAGSSVAMPAAMQLFLWEAQQGLYDDGRPVFTSAAVELLHRKVLDACDTLDGIPDRQIDDPRQCRFDPAELACSEGEDGDATCLNADQVAAARAYYRGPSDADGHALFPGGAPYGGELGWIGRGSPIETGKFAAQSFLQYLLLPDLPADFTWRDWRFSKESLQRLIKGGELYDAGQPDISTFQNAGGKLLMWQGFADNAAGAYGMLDYYQAMRDQMGGLDNVRSFARMFLVPGGYHCVGGYVPYDQDFLGAVVNWVETGKAPDAVTAVATLDDDTIRTRPLYAYPTGTRYLGGDVNSASSFEPREPSNIPQDGFDWPGSLAQEKPLHISF